MVAAIVGSRRSGSRPRRERILVANGSQNLLLIFHDDIQGLLILLDLNLVLLDLFLVLYDEIKLIFLYLFPIFQDESRPCAMG
jgi:hypothetical protein